MMDAGTAVVGSLCIILLFLLVLVVCTFVAGVQRRSQRRSYPVTPPPYIERQKRR